MYQTALRSGCRHATEGCVCLVLCLGQAPVHFELDTSDRGGVGGLHVRARNRNTFASTANLLLGWRLLLDGAPLIVADPAQRDVSGWYPGGSVAIAPQARCCPILPLCPLWPEPEGCYLLIVYDLYNLP